MNYGSQFTNFKEVLSSSITQIDKPREVTASDGVNISWVEFGSGTPLVISPALGTPLASWLPAIKELSDVFRVIFVLTRGGYEGPIPRNSDALTVERRGDDLVELIDALDLRKYFMAAHSSGVSPVVVSLKKLSRPPSHVCLISSRYDAGPSINAQDLLQRARENSGFLNVVKSVVLGFSPPSLSGLIRQNLSDFSRLEALLRAFEHSRAFSYVEDIKSGISITFIITELDPDDVRNTTRRLVGAHLEESWELVDVEKVGHFFIQSDGTAAAKLITKILDRY